MAVKQYILESYDELRNKVTWPSWKELQASSVLVLVASFIIAAVIYLMDVGFSQVTNILYQAIY